MGIIKEFSVHVLHLIFPRIFIWKDAIPVNNRYRLILSFYDTLCWSFVLTDVLKFVYYSIRYINIAERRLGRSRELGRAISIYASALMTMPFFGFAVKMHTKALHLREILGDHHGTAVSLQYMGFCFQWMAEYARAVESLNRSVTILIKIGDLRQLALSVVPLCQCYWLIADHERLAGVIEQLKNISSKGDDKYGLCCVWLYKSIYHFQKGDMLSAETHAMNAMNMSRNHELWVVYYLAAITMGQVSLEENDTESAMKHLMEAEDLYGKHQFLKHYSVLIFLLKAELLLECFMADDSKNNSRKKRDLKDVRKHCKNALKRTAAWPSHYGIALRINAKYLSMIGKSRKADECYNMSIEYNRRIGRRYEEAKSHNDYGMFLFQTGNSVKAKDNLEKAYFIFADIASVLYQDRIGKILGINTVTAEANPIQRMLENGRAEYINKIVIEITDSADINHMLDTVIAKSVEMTCAQRGYLIMVNEKNEHVVKSFKDVSGAGPMVYSKHIVESVFRRGNYIITESIVSFGLRSILCLALKSWDKVIGVCYLDNPLSAGIFTGEQAELMQSLMFGLTRLIENTVIDEKEGSEAGEGKQPIITEVTSERMEKAINYIKENFMSDISREGLALSVEMSPDYLGKLFKVYTGKKMSDYINELRINEAIRLLKLNNSTIAEIASSVGFENVKTFNRVFLKITSKSPRNYRNFGEIS
jgi:AraC-like DNA-binding protein/tetratricopeptide (TPR) repeat protein